MKIFSTLAITAIAVIVLASSLITATKLNEQPDRTVFHSLARTMMHHDSAAVYNLSMKSLPGCITMQSCKICANYCGPGWCAETYIPESSCVAEGIWGSPAASGSENCVDSCCRTHDHCCGLGQDRAVCNTDIVSCLDNDDCGGLCSDAVWAAMKIVSHFCCGSRCPSYSADSNGHFVPMSLAGKSVCNKQTGLKLKFTSDSSVQVHHQQGQQACGQVNTRVSLNQASNRISFGTNAVDKKNRGLVQLPEECDSNGVFSKSSLLKAWFFPHTGDVLIRDVEKVGQYLNFEACQ